MKKSKFHLRLKELRKNHGYTQIDISRLIGLSETAVTNYERNKRRPEYEVLMRLADIFGVSVDYLIGHSDDGAMRGIPENIKDIVLDSSNTDWIILIPYFKTSGVKPSNIRNIVKEIKEST